MRAIHWLMVSLFLRFLDGLKAVFFFCIFCVFFVWPTVSVFLSPIFSWLFLKYFSLPMKQAMLVLSGHFFLLFFFQLILYAFYCVPMWIESFYRVVYRRDCAQL